MAKNEWKVRTVEVSELEAALASFEDDDFEVQGIHPLPAADKVSFAVIAKKKRTDTRPQF